MQIVAEKKRTHEMARKPSCQVPFALRFHSLYSLSIYDCYRKAKPCVDIISSVRQTNRSKLHCASLGEGSNVFETGKLKGL